ncbi:MAG: hypothetical protein ACYT04_86810, partial [Nostoc sp.]
EFYSHLITLAHHSVLTHSKKGSTNRQSATRKIGYWVLGIGHWALGILLLLLHLLGQLGQRFMGQLVID